MRPAHQWMPPPASEVTSESTPNGRIHTSALPRTTYSPAWLHQGDIFLNSARAAYPPRRPPSRHALSCTIMPLSPCSPPPAPHHCPHPPHPASGSAPDLPRRPLCGILPLSRHSGTYLETERGPIRGRLCLSGGAGRLLARNPGMRLMNSHKVVRASHAPVLKAFQRISGVRHRFQPVSGLGKTHKEEPT